MIKTAFRSPIVLLGLFLYVRWLSVAPQVSLPSTTLPSPNGRDALYAAYQLMANEKAVHDALPGLADYLPTSLVRKRALVASNAAALRATRAALLLSYGNTTSKFAGTNRYEFADVDALCDLLILDADVRAADGDAAGSVNGDVDAILLGTLVRHGGGIDDEGSADAIESFAASRVWPQIARLGKGDERKAALRLDKITCQRVSFPETMEQEKWIRERQMAAKLRNRSTFSVESDYIFEDGSYSEAPNTHDMSPRRLLDAYTSLLFQNKDRFLADYGTMMDGYIARSKQPFSGAAGDPGVSPNPALYGLNIWYFNYERRKDTRVRAETGLLVCALALRSYEERHGQNPDTLSELVSDGELTAVPEDPLARVAGTPFQYHRTGVGKYVLFCSGPDGFEDDGRPIGWNSADAVKREIGDRVVEVNVGSLAPQAPVNPVSSRQ